MITRPTDVDAALAHLSAAIGAMDQAAVSYTDRRMPAERDQLLNDMYLLRTVGRRLEDLQAASKAG